MPEALTGNEFLDKLLDQTPAAAVQPRHAQNYNFPQRLFLKPDGTVVSLQGDPQNRAYYEQKGFKLLTDIQTRGAAKSEVRQYLEDEYPTIVKQQRDKAALITAIRRAGERYRDLNLEDTFDDYTVEEVREYLADIKRETGKDIRVILPRRAQAREDARDAALMRGVETAETQSLEGLQAKLVQGTGYDPMEQARRTRGRTGATA